MRQIKSHVATIAQAKGLPTIAALARAAGLSRGTVRNYWGRTPQRCYSTTLARLCWALRAQVADLLVYIPDSEEAAIGEADS